MTRNVTGLAGWVLAVLAVLAALPAGAHGYKVLYSFCAQANCADGGEPDGLIEDSAGNFYGTVYGGGANGFGGIFEMRHGRGSHYKYTLLYSFCAQQNCADGGYPTGGLILDTKGNLYGSALIGGNQGNGEVFELAHKGKAWNLHILYAFCPQGNNCTDGVGPDAGLAYAGQQSGALYDGKSPLYGTTDGGGLTGLWQGVVFEIAPVNGGWNYQVIYSFCAQANCADGAYSYSRLVEDASGNLYGTTIEGGTNSAGTAFELSPSNGSWSEEVLYNFCSAAGCADGDTPKGGLMIDASGNLDGATLDGATLDGGASCSISGPGCGVAFSIAPGGSETVLHTFCKHAGCADGANPLGNAATDGSGTQYATAYDGGDTAIMHYGGGTLYELGGGGFKVLHKFCGQAVCADGATPLAGPLRDSAGHLFGTASTGGKNNGGVVYEIE